MNGLIKECLNLPREDKTYLIGLLSSSLRDRTVIPGRFRELLEYASLLCGDNIMSRARDHYSCIGRMMIAYQLREEGYTLSEIGRQMGRHHATIIHMCKMMEDVLLYRTAFRIEYTFWVEFQKLIKDDIQQGTNDDSLSVGEEI